MIDHHAWNSLRTTLTQMSPFQTHVQNKIHKGLGLPPSGKLPKAS